MNSQSRQSDTVHALDPWVRALHAQEPKSEHIEAAQRKLNARLRSTGGTSSWRHTGWAWAAAAVMAVLVLPMVIWMPGSSGSLAFAEVQRYFTDFHSLRVHMTTRLRDQTLLDMRTRMDDQERIRVDVGEDFSYVIDSQNETMLQLFHGQQRALRVPLKDSDEQPPEEALGWLEELREYQGVATPIDQPSMIRGREATGFRLEAGGLEMVLWATPEGEPMRMEMRPLGEPDVAAPITRLEFFFNESLDDSWFSLALPAGYELLSGQDSD